MLETELGLMNKLAQISKISASTNTQHGKKHTLKWILIPRLRSEAGRLTG